MRDADGVAVVDRMTDIDRRLSELGDTVDAWLREAVADVAGPARRFGEILEYHFGWRDEGLRPLDVRAPSGKRLRPALVLLASEAVCGRIEPGREAAMAVELIHNFSLVHDDIQDHSALRRHRRTVWSIWGMPQGINAGDALFALAQTVILQPGTALAAQAGHELNATALALAEGQFLDIAMAAGEVPPTPQCYEEMITRKTGVLFACAARLGAMAGGAPREVQDRYAEYGLQLGLAFQEQDDMLGVWGLSADTGKPDAADVYERKRGLPAAMALSRPDAPAWLHAAYEPGERTMSAELVERVVAHFDALGVREQIEEQVENRYRMALDCLEKAEPRQPAGSYLAAICEALVARRT